MTIRATQMSRDLKRTKQALDKEKAKKVKSKILPLNFKGPRKIKQNSE